MVTQERLKELFDYNPETGLFIRKVTTHPAAKKGAIAGCANGFGYWKVRVDGKFYKCHRLAWLYIYGEFPSGDLDHKNGNRGDNRINNLRVASRSENNANSKGRKKLKGISWNGHSWIARIKKNKKDIHIGSFQNRREALAAYAKAAERLFGSFARVSATVLLLVIIAGCAPTLSSVNPEGAKRIAQAAFRPISWSKKDTTQTVREIKIHNEVGVKLGLWKYPPKARKK